MATAERTAEVVWNGNLLKGEGRFSVGSGALPELPVSWPARTRESGGKTSPEELIAAAHAACYAMALSNTLAQAGHEPEELRVRATCTFDVDAVKIASVDLEVEVRAAGLDADALEPLARAGEEGCPVSNALRGNVEMRLSASLAE